MGNNNTVRHFTRKTPEVNFFSGLKKTTANCRGEKTLSLLLERNKTFGTKPIKSDNALVVYRSP